MRRFAWASLFFVGCTTVDMARLPSMEHERFFLTQESVSGSYESLGLVQVTRRGVLLFGFADPAGTDLAAAVAQLEPQVRASGADGAMNVRVTMTQYPTATKILGLIFFFVPLPSEVTITGELVRMRQGPPGVVPNAPPPYPAPSPGGAPL